MISILVIYLPIRNLSAAVANRNTETSPNKSQITKHRYKKGHKYKLWTQIKGTKLQNESKIRYNY